MVNKVLLIGNLGADPEVKTTQGGSKYVTMRLATNKSWKDKDGNKREKVVWHRIVVYQKNLVEIAEKFYKKGNKIYIEGELDTREYEKNGETRTITEVLVNGFRCEMFSLEKREGSEGGGKKPEVPDRDDRDFDDQIPF